MGISLSHDLLILVITFTEMPTSGDLKSTEDSLFLTIRPLPQQIDPAPNGNDLGHHMKSYMKYILSNFAIIVLLPGVFRIRHRSLALPYESPYLPGKIIF